MASLLLFTPNMAEKTVQVEAIARKRRRLFGVIAILALLLSILAVAYKAVPALSRKHRHSLLQNRMSPIAAVDAGAFENARHTRLEAVADPGSENIDYVLLLGVDRSTGEIGRTDAILIAAFNHTRDEIGLISIPRDIRVTAPGLDPRRINAVVRVANRELGEGQGIPALKAVISNTLGIDIDYTLTADFEGFVNIVDFLQGIPVHIDCPIEDCFHTDEADAGCAPLSLAAGNHFLDGETALKFVRSRHGRTDIDRTRRQQAVLAGLKKRLTRASIIPKLPKLWQKLNRYIGTDLDFQTALEIGLLIATADRSALHGLVLRSPVVVPATLADGKQVLLLDDKKAKEAVAGLFNAPRPGERPPGARCPAADVGLNWRKQADVAHRASPPRRPEIRFPLSEGERGTGE